MKKHGGLKMKSNITLEQFKGYMEPIRIYLMESDRAEEGLKLLFPSSFVVSELGGKLLESYINLLSDLLDLPIEDDWINYFVFECNMGKTPRMVTWTKDSEELGATLDSIEAFYNFLTKDC
jgi:hypothetical protein